MSKLHAILKPFLLRRIKLDVENSLPAKKEIILYAHMTDKQMEFNEQLRDRTLNVSCVPLLCLSRIQHGGTSWSPCDCSRSVRLLHPAWDSAALEDALHHSLQEQ